MLFIPHPSSFGSLSLGVKTLLHELHEASLKLVAWLSDNLEKSQAITLPNIRVLRVLRG